MAEKKDPKKEKKGKRKPAPQDIEKTVLDIDIRNLDLGMDDTVMVRAPKDEDSDLHEADFFEAEERTGEHDLSGEPVHKEKPRPPEKVSKKPAPAVLPKKTPPPSPGKKPDPSRAAPPSTAKNPALESSYQVIRHERSLVFTILSLAIFLLLTESLVEVLKQGGALRLPGILATVFGGLLFAALLGRRVESKIGFLWLIAAWFGLISYSGYNFFTSDPESLHFFKLSLEVLMGPILCAVGGAIALIQLTEKKLPWVFKVLAVLAWLALLVGYGFCLFSGQSMEDGLWGPPFLRDTPLLFRPTVLALAFAFPFFLVSLLLASLLAKAFRRRLLRGVALPLLLLAVFGTLLGAKLLFRQGVRVPLVGGWVEQDYLGSTTFDPMSGAVRLQIQQGKAAPGNRLNLVVGVSQSLDKGNARQSFLMVRNPEGRTFAASLDEHLALLRGDKKITGVKVMMELARLGMPREIALVIGLPDLADPSLKNLLEGAIYRLADQLKPQDRLLLVSTSGVQILTRKNEEEWKHFADKALVATPASLQDLNEAAQKGFSRGPALKQLIILSDVNGTPKKEQREIISLEAGKNKLMVSFVALGKPESQEEGVYLASGASSLGFSLLSAATENLGDFSLKLPNLAALPKIVFSRDATGQVALQQGKIGFRILAQDPSVIKTLQFKIDEEKPLDLESAQLEQVVDLSRYKVKPGVHRFSFLLTTQSGDVVSETFETKYLIRQPLEFIKPMDRDTIAGTLNVLFSPGGAPGVGTQSIDLLVDGNKMGSATTEPFLIPLDPTTLSEGERTLQAVQTYSDGTTESAQIQVIVNAKAPQIKIVRPTLGEYLPNLAELEAEVGGGLFQQVQKVEFLVDGEWVGESLQAPFRFLWSNTSYPTGKYFIQAHAHLSSQATVTDAVQIQLGQGELVVQADPNVSSSGMLFPENVEVLLDNTEVMNQSVGSTIKQDLAKFVLTELSHDIPENVRLISRIYGGQSEEAQVNCKDSTLLKNSSKELAILKARGISPLAYALDQLSKDLKKSSGSRVALLIAGGWDKCGEDPIAVAERLVKQGERIRLHVIYFSDTDPATESLLKRLAEVMGGRVYRVHGQDEIREALRDAIQVSFSLLDYKNTPVVEQPLSQKPFTVRAGEYRLEVDTAPSLRQDNVIVNTGGKKTFTVLSLDGKYELKEE